MLKVSRLSSSESLISADRDILIPWNVVPSSAHTLACCWVLDATPDNTLYLTAEARCYSLPFWNVFPCTECLEREANRVEKNERKRLASQQTKASTSTDPAEARRLAKGKSVARDDRPPVPTTMVAFNNQEVLDFRDGRVSLTFRVICYSKKHHNEPLGFQYVLVTHAISPSL